MQSFQDSEERLRIIADNTYDWEYWRAPAGGYFWISPAFETITGYSLDAFLGDDATRTRVRDIIHPQDRQFWENHIDQVEKGESEQEEFEIRVVKANGDTIWIKHTCKSIYGSNGEYLGKRGCNRDVTEHRRMIEQLIKSQQDLTSLLSWKNNILDVSAFGLLVVTDQRVITEVNKGFVEMFGYAPEEIIGCPAEILHISPEMSHTFKEKYWEITAQKKVVAVEWQLKKKNGQILWCSFAGSALDMRDLRKGVVWIIRDISERKHMELVLRESEERFRTLFEQSLDAIAIMDGFPPSFHYVNPAFVQLFGYSLEEIRQLRGERIWSIVYPEDLPHLQESLGKRMRGEETSARYEFRIVRKDREVRWVETVGYRSQIGDKVFNQSIYRDITSRKQAEEQQRQLEVKLQQSQKMEAIGTLAGGIAHDFNNILSAILGYGEMVRDASPLGSANAHYIGKVLEAGQRASALVKQILAFSRQSQAERILVEPVHIVKEALKLLRPAIPSTIAIRQHFEVSDTKILADPTQIHQIVMNLCTNAFHAMEHSGGVLDVHLDLRTLAMDDLRQYPKAKPGEFVVLSVGDSGPGIPPHIRDKIFDPFFTTKEIGKGTGMGLAIVHGIVTTTGGFITCSSELKKGTVLQVFFPVVGDGTVFAPRPPVDDLPGGKERILLVDDEEMLADMCKVMLERLGYQVTACTSSTDALTLFLANPDQFDCVITDQTMPDMTGFDLARRILLTRPNVPVILCTGFSNLVDEELAKGYGIKGFVMKPMTKREIAFLLRTLLDV
ncbi:MAG: PAS domain S-box protein [Desulfobulbus sp.]|nr:PAS domain S-box protein [Desulfobulbus sp.]